MEITQYMETHGHEQLCAFTNKGVGLKAFIAIHDTTLGPSLGGLRIWPYQDEDAAILDVLRLSKAMTYKSSAAGLNFGGGKAVIVASHEQKNKAMIQSFGKFVQAVAGRYITTEDVGSTPSDMAFIAESTSYVTGLPMDMGGSGDPSEMTGYGVFQGMRACAEEVWGRPSLEGKTVAVQGFGKVASYMVNHILEDGGKVIVTDVNKSALDRAKSQGIEVLDDTSKIYDLNCDIFSPCALGGVINSETIPKIHAEIIAGCANNQLLREGDAIDAQKRGILYAPDYIINAGGVINISMEFGRKYSQEDARVKTGAIYDTMRSIMQVVNRSGISTAEAADQLAEQRIEKASNGREIYLP